MPMAETRSDSSNADGSDCLKIACDLFISPAPTACATCTAKPAAAALIKAPKSHVVDATKPTDAEASAPNEPTIAASIYSMMISEI